jgi:purine-binding chemotaxis protein CheW
VAPTKKSKPKVAPAKTGAKRSKKKKKAASSPKRPKKTPAPKTKTKKEPPEPAVSPVSTVDDDPHTRALDEFFASASELETVGSMSLDLYRDQLDSRLRAEGVQEYLSFVLANETFAVNIFGIKEIIKLPLITEVPRTEPVILGILSLRGTIAPVVDLRRRLNLETTPQTRKSRVLIVQSVDGLAGLLVDEVRHVIRLKDENIEPPPGVFDRAEAEHIVGVGRHEGEMYTLLELESVVQIDRFINVRSGSKSG